jgi:hypothetical protein
MWDRVRTFSFVPIDEGVAEGTHRCSHKEMLRAPSSSLPWMFSAQRLDQNLAEVQSVPAELGRPDMLDDYWRDFKQILQFRTQASVSSCPVRMKNSSFFKKLYRLGDEALIDTGCLGYRSAQADSLLEDADTGSVTGPLSDVQKLWEQFLEHFLTAKVFFTIPSSSAPFFKVYQVISASGRRRKIIKFAGIRRTIGSNHAVLRGFSDDFFI